jgi:hypothetical protein
MEQSIFPDVLLYLGYTLVLVAAAAAILLPLVNALSSPQSLIKTGVGVLALVVIYFLSYAFSGAEVTPEYAARGIGPDLSKAVGGTLIMAYILLGISVFGILYTEVSKILK